MSNTLARRKDFSTSWPSFLRGSYLLNYFNYVAGVDEVGRGALAGPVVAGIVLIDKKYSPIDGVNDSKILSSAKRLFIFDQVKKTKGLHWSVGFASNQEIDLYGIRQATYLAMIRAYWSLALKPDVVLVDGVKSVKNLPFSNVFYYPHGDSKSHLIALASIIAKVVRDRFMERYSLIYPQYSWHKNKGYGTKQHFDAIKEHGATEFHRQSFLQSV